MSIDGRGNYGEFEKRFFKFQREQLLRRRQENREKKIQFKQKLQELKEIRDSEAIIATITEAVDQGICNIKDLTVILGIVSKQKKGGKIWKIADYVRKNWSSLNVDGLLVERARELIEPGIEHVLNETIVPADFLEQSINGEGSEYIPPSLIPREKYLLEVLTDLEIKGDLLERWEGKNSSTMIRGESYSLWIIKELDMMVLVCDEEGNRTFVIDGSLSPYNYIRKTKSELQQMANVKNFIWTDVDSWKRKLEELLICFDDVEVCDGVANKRDSIDKKDLPRENENNELIFDEKKYLTIKSLEKLEIVDGSYNKIKRIIRENKIQGIKGRDKTNRTLDFYPFEEVKKHTNVNKDLEKANEDNEVLDEDGKRYLTVNSLGRLSEVCASARKIEKIIKENNIQSIKGKKRGQVCDFYPIEEVKKYTNV